MTRRLGKAYHFTSIDNLGSIIENGILSTNQKKRESVQHLDIAEKGIQSRRETMIIPNSSGRRVHDYVPFYFAKRTPMLLSVIKKKNIDQQRIIYFSVRWELMKSKKGSYYTNKAANAEEKPIFFSGEEQFNQLSQLDWKTIDDNAWRYSGDAKKRKMAELLLPGPISLCDVEEIITYDEVALSYVKRIFRGKGLPIENVVCVDENHYFKRPPKWEESLVVGPIALCSSVKKAIHFVTNFSYTEKPNFQSLAGAVEAIRKNFGVIKELYDLQNLYEDYRAYNTNVSFSSQGAMSFVKNTDEYKKLNDYDRCILEFCTYLHNIGKSAPSNVQEINNKRVCRRVDSYSSDSLPMLKRILTEELPRLPDGTVRKIVIMVVYGDILIDIINNGRSKEQLLSIITCNEEIDMLAALSKAYYAKGCDNEVERIKREIKILTNEAKLKLC